MYENTGPRAHQMAADLIAAGVDAHAIYRRLYEGIPQGKLELLARGLTNVERFDDGLLTVTHLTRDDYAATGADESYSEGVVDHLRSRRGHRRRRARARPARRRRAGAQGLAAGHRRPRRRLGIARAQGGGGHRRAAGFSTRPRVPRARRVPARRSSPTALPESPTGSSSVDKPAGITSHDVVAAVRRRLGKGVKVGHAGTLDPFATGLLLVLVGRATRVQRFLMALPKRYETVARLGCTSTTGDRDGEIAPGRMPRRAAVLPTGPLRQRPPAYSAVKSAGARLRAGPRAARTVEIAEREVEVTRFEQLWRDGDRAAFAIECSSGTYVRSLIADLGDAYCLELRRTAIGDFDVADAAPSADRAARRRAGFLPAVDARGRRRPPGGPRRGGARRTPTASCGCSTPTA